MRATIAFSDLASQVIDRLALEGETPAGTAGVRWRLCVQSIVRTL